MPLPITRFDRDTAVQDGQVGQDGQEGQVGSLQATLDPGWTVGGGLNGGYLLATIGTALRRRLPGHPDPLSVSAYYLSASEPGPASIDVTVRREGGRVATASADLRQGDVARIAALATYGDLGRDADVVETTAVPFDLPPLEECVGNRDAAPGAHDTSPLPPLLSRFDLRFHPEHVGWATGEPNGRAELAAWFRLEDHREPDPLALLLVVDALPPALFGLGRLGWAPTLELTVHVRARPAPGWLRVRHVSRNIAGGMFEEDCEVWDAASRLVAQSRQLARVPR